MSGIHKTSRGSKVDLDQLKMANQDMLRVGNTDMNVRGDIVRNGQIVKTREEITQENYNISGNNIVRDVKSRDTRDQLQPDIIPLAEMPPEAPTVVAEEMPSVDIPVASIGKRK